jgi:PAS domain S-box-containing protein
MAMEQEMNPEDYSRGLIEASLEPLVAISPDGTIMDFNHALVSMTGISRMKLMGMEFATCFSDPEKARRGFQQAIRTGSIVDYPLVIRHENGSEWEVLYNASSRYDRDGNLSGIFVTTRSITHQVEQQKSISKLQEELRLWKGDLESFSYSVSHDLRAPLRAVDGFIAMFLSKYLDQVDDEGQRLLETVRKNVKHLGSLMDELLLLSGTGMKGIQLSPINMNELALAVVEEYKTPEYNAEIVIHNLNTVKGDTVLVRQVLGNLLSNALKFSAKTEAPKIEIGCEVKGTETHFFVRDNGIGFNMDYSSKLFGVFQRLCDPEEYAGHGMGLSIVKRIITLHGGKVWAEGIENKGATFFFSLKNH